MATHLYDAFVAVAHTANGWARGKLADLRSRTVNLTIRSLQSLNGPLILVKFPMAPYELIKAEQELIFISFFWLEPALASFP